MDLKFRCIVFIHTKDFVYKTCGQQTHLQNWTKKEKNHISVSCF